MRERLEKRLAQERDKIIVSIWKTKIYSMADMAKMFRITTVQVFQIIKKWNEKKELEVLDEWYHRQVQLYESNKQKK